MIRPISKVKLQNGDVSLTSLIDKIDELIEIVNMQETSIENLSLKYEMLKRKLKYEYGVD